MKLTPEEFSKAMLVLQETFRVALGDGGLEGYWMVLQRLEAKELQAACLKAMTDCEFMPAPAKLLALARAARNENALVEATDRKVAELRAWRERPPGRELEAIRETVRELAEMKALDEKGPS